MDIETIETMPKIFSIDSVNPRHDCYHDPEDRLKIYLISQFVEVCQYLSYELELDKGIFLLVVRETSNFGIIHGHAPVLFFEVAGFDATSEKASIDFLVEKVMQRVFVFRNEKYDKLSIELKLRAALLSEDMGA